MTLTESDIEEAADLFQDHAEELGFINKARVEDGPLFIEKRDGEVVGAALADHLSTKPFSWLRDIVVREDYRREGIGELLIEQIRNDSRHAVLKAKCPVDLPANDFYSDMGWELTETIDVEDGRNLNVWELGRPEIQSASQPDW